MISLPRKLVRRSNTAEFGDHRVANSDRPGPSLFALAVSDRIPRVFEFPNTPDGIESLANLVRCEDVLAVIEGWRTGIQMESVVSLSVQHTPATHRLIVERKGAHDGQA